MKARTLKELSKKLDMTVKTLKGIGKGEKRSGGDITKSNMAKCLGTISKFTGYSSQEKAAKAIEKDIRLLYTSPEELYQRISRIKIQNEKVNKQFRDALLLLKGGKLKSFFNFLQKMGLRQWIHPTATKIDESLIERFRECNKQNKKNAEKIRGRFRIMVKSESQITKSINKRAKRWGVTASLFWEAALKFHPNPKVKGIVAGKKKIRQKKKGSSVQTRHTNKGVMTAKISHQIEKKNSRFRRKLNRQIKTQEKYWSGRIEKEIMAYIAMDRLLGK